MIHFGCPARAAEEASIRTNDVARSMPARLSGTRAATEARSGKADSAGLGGEPALTAWTPRSTHSRGP
jgi:hypothetical protein